MIHTYAVTNWERRRIRVVSDLSLEEISQKMARDGSVLFRRVIFRKEDGRRIFERFEPVLIGSDGLVQIEYAVAPCELPETFNG